ncbi:MAG: hypothetical protein IJ678_09050 [Kiritimatiellae bacterium]|nr:hypothetical protein [Kiritimatiellia bacterium]
MITFEKNFSSGREDGRYVCTMAAHLAAMRSIRRELALPENPSPDGFDSWRRRIAEKTRELLRLPSPSPQPPPKMLWREERDGYAAEKWEFYPDRFSAVPVLALVPAGAGAARPVPAVMCYPGSNHSKETLCGEPLPGHPNWPHVAHEERNRMALHLVREGWAAVAFDNPGIGETSVITDPAAGETQWNTRVQFTHGLLDAGWSYLGLTVHQRLRFFDFLDAFPWLDRGKIAISSHSLGTESAVAVALLREDVRAVVFNEFLHDDLRRYVAITEEPENEMTQNVGNWHVVPGRLAAFGFPEQCAALAPRWLAITEGGPDDALGLVRRAYAAAGAPERFEVSYYPAFADPASRAEHRPIPDRGLTRDEFYRQYSYCIPEDHSFRAAPAISLLRKAFAR